MKTNGWIYALSDHRGHIKIGKTSRLTRRIKRLEILLPFPVRVLICYPVEDYHQEEIRLHRELANFRANGEWFKLSDVELFIHISEYINFSEALCEDSAGELVSFYLQEAINCPSFFFTWFEAECVKFLANTLNLPKQNIIQSFAPTLLGELEMEGI